MRDVIRFLGFMSLLVLTAVLLQELIPFETLTKEEILYYPHIVKVPGATCYYTDEPQVGARSISCVQDAAEGR